MEIFIIVLVCLIGLIVLGCIFNAISKAKRNTVKNTSYKIKELLRLQKAVGINISYSHKIEARQTFSTKRKLDSFNFENEKDRHTEKMLELIARKLSNNFRYKEYIDFCNNIKNIITPENIIKETKIKINKYKNIENDLFVDIKEKIKNDTEKIILHIYASYTSPAGRNHWYREKYYNDYDFPKPKVNIRPIAFKMSSDLMLESSKKTKLEISTSIQPVKNPSKVFLREPVIDGVKYRLVDEKAALIIGVSEEIKTISIPSSINANELEYSVIGIESKAFANNEFLEEIVFSNTIQKIGAESFKGCKKLRKINLNDGLKEISIKSFFGCASLEEIVIPKSITILRKETFSCCANLKNIYIPKSVAKIESNCFWLNNNLVIHLESLKNIDLFDDDWNPDGCRIEQY